MVPGEVFPEAGKYETVATLRSYNSLVLWIINMINITGYQYIKIEHKREWQSKAPTCFWGGVWPVSGTAPCYCSGLDLEIQLGPGWDLPLLPSRTTLASSRPRCRRPPRGLALEWKRSRYFRSCDVWAGISGAAMCLIYSRLLLRDKTYCVLEVPISLHRWTPTSAPMTPTLQSAGSAV